MSITSAKIKLLCNPKSVEYYEMLSKKTNQVIHKKTKKKNHHKYFTSGIRNQRHHLYLHINRTYISNTDCSCFMILQFCLCVNAIGLIFLIKILSLFKKIPRKIFIKQYFFFAMRNYRNKIIIAYHFNLTRSSDYKVFFNSRLQFFNKQQNIAIFTL